MFCNFEKKENLLPALSLHSNCTLLSLRLHLGFTQFAHSLHSFFKQATYLFKIINLWTLPNLTTPTQRKIYKYIVSLSGGGQIRNSYKLIILNSDRYKKVINRGVRLVVNVFSLRLVCTDAGPLFPIFLEGPASLGRQKFAVFSFKKSKIFQGGAVGASLVSGFCLSLLLLPWAAFETNKQLFVQGEM